MASLTVHAGVVKFPAGKVFTTQYGDRVNAVVTIQQTGEEIKLWGSPGDGTLTALKKGQQVSLAQDQKGWKLLSVPPAEDAAPTSNGNGKRKEHTPLTVEEKRAIASYIDELGDLFGYCQKVATAKNLGTEEEMRAIATTLFIQAVRKFNL